MCSVQRFSTLPEIKVTVVSSALPMQSVFVMLWQVLELEPSSSWAAKMVQDLQPEVQQRQEKMKEEMMGMYRIAAVPVNAIDTMCGLVLGHTC